jgi:hypothetical protein
MADADYNIATFDDNGLLPPVRAVERIAGGGDLEKAWQLLRNAVRDGALTAYVVDNQDSIFKADPLGFELADRLPFRTLETSSDRERSKN